MAEWTGGREGEGRGEEWRNKGRNIEERENVDFARIPAGAHVYSRFNVPLDT